MFNIFKKKSSRKIIETFSSATENQKSSVINFLIAVSGIDSDPNIKEQKCINKYEKILGVTSQQWLDRLEKYGKEQAIADLKQLNTQQIKLLFRMALETADCDDVINHYEQVFLETNFTSIGLSTLEQKQILQSIIDDGCFI